MSIWDEVEAAEEEKGDSSYLDDSDKSIQLIANLLKYDNSSQTKMMQRKIDKLDELLDKELLFSLKSIDLRDELKLYNDIRAFSDKLREQNRLVLLKNKVVVGVGGMFSAGKSCFINSILGEQVLPEDQDATTSIPTYVIKGNERKNYAYVRDNQKVDLDDAAVNSISHEFKRKYGIGFAGYISNIVIQMDTFKYPNISLLDTPGYSKDDSDVLEEMADASKAKEQLRAIDYLIWLVDVENGTVQQKDIEFIKKLRIDTPILFVVNKASRKPISFVRNIVEQTKQFLTRANISYFDVIAYDSMEGSEYLDNNGLQRFMKEADMSDKRQENIDEELNKMIDQMLIDLEDRKQYYVEQIMKIRKSIINSKDNLRIQSLVYIYSDLQNKVRNVTEGIESIQRTRKRIEENIKYIGLSGEKM